LRKVIARAVDSNAALAMNQRIASRPYVAYTRFDLARLLLAHGDHTRARELLEAARRTAEDLDMPRLRGLVQKLAREHPRTTDDAPVATAVAAALRREGDEWTVAYGGESFRLKDVKGFAYLTTLLRHPGQEFHALDLGGGVGTAAATPRELADEGLAARDLGDAGELLDAEARAAYKERLEELLDELEEAKRHGDVERATETESELEILTRELARATGLGGRSRRAGSAAERARLNVTRSISSAIKKIAAASPALGEHLAAAVRTGLFCVYSPDPRRPIDWDTGS
jgi:hypothetical protein